MKTDRKISESRGLILPMVAVAMVALLGFIALAIDIGMIAVARTQSQNAADTAAMAGARALNGNTSGGYNETSAKSTAINAATASTIQANGVPKSQVDVKIGSYTYDYYQSKFVANIPTLSTDTPNLVKSTITATGQNLFGRMLGNAAFNVSATATAVHRPRDVAVILDMSGSMRFDSLLGAPYSGARTQSNNPEAIYPQFGHYSSSLASLQNTTGPDTISGDTFGLANISVATAAGDPIVGDFYQNALGGTPVPAFTAAPDSYATAPDGDTPLVAYRASTHGQTVQQITNGATFNGYTATPFTNYTGPTVPEFKGYTRGPGYWGKTFFIWPPDPRTANDWRQKFFGTTDNTALWDSSGNWKVPSSSTYSINYAAILAWIKQTPNPFPTKLRAGRILYYDAIPTTISTSSYPPSDPNQRFWKEYIDYVIGLYQKSSSSWDVVTKYTGYGDDYTWGTVKISAKPTGTNAKYMDYGDNPERPKLHFWFGPMTMVDFLGNYNMWSQYANWNPYWPGNCHEGPLWACKLGVQSALQDIKNNHPNDFVSLMYFSTPKYSASDSGSFNRVRVPLGRDYARLSDTLWFPPSTIDTPGTEIRPYDTDNLDVPRAFGGTTTVMGFMLAYNQLSGNAALRTFAPSPAPVGDAGGLGRKGAQRLIILETDGMANTAATAAFVNGGANNSYYKVRQPGEYPTNSGTVTTQIYSVVNQICALETASAPGYSTTRKPVLVHCMGLGPIFDPSTNSTQRAAALDLLQNIQYIGSTQATATTPLASYKVITGTSQQRADKIRQAFSAIMQDGVQVSLID
ncbi:Putative Flp pilus-assembly TadE/G-like [Singulisphaera sp. GP187]|uniref:pilus assembly protein TadG-related protein n=1 Tax=Singulisphaera sp. GP187 TaxID=1882752 RepID=UPI00092A71DD|nr:pilus assembly protein TadG-related protein [Singulisphaera sp. GP187]SIO31616.1 Putative Flp pilus-assembly TadE/G-like [Singulisphaera sp. GP187]